VACGAEFRRAEIRADADEHEDQWGERNRETDEPVNHETPPGATAGD